MTLHHSRLNRKCGQDGLNHLAASGELVNAAPCKPLTVTHTTLPSTTEQRTATLRAAVQIVLGRK